MDRFMQHSYQAMLNMRADVITRWIHRFTFSSNAKNST